MWRRRYSAFLIIWLKILLIWLRGGSYNIPQLRPIFEPCLKVCLAQPSVIFTYLLQIGHIWMPISFKRKRSIFHPALAGKVWSADPSTHSSYDVFVVTGVLHLKDIQDEQLPKEQHYIRKILVIDAAGLPQHEEDDPSDSEHGEPEIRIIICMTKEGSERLLRSSGYIQSDIGFKRVVGFLEFEMACMDRDANTSTYIHARFLWNHFIIWTSRPLRRHFLQSIYQ